MKNEAFDKGILASVAIIYWDFCLNVCFNESTMTCKHKIWNYEVIRKGYQIIPYSAYYYYDKNSKNIICLWKTFFREQYERSLFINSNNFLNMHIKDFLNNIFLYGN
jgi:hypothetical protein